MEKASGFSLRIVRVAQNQWAGRSAARDPALNKAEKFCLGAEGGSRTLTRFEPYGILSPARLPFRHPGFLLKLTFTLAFWVCSKTVKS